MSFRALVLSGLVGVALSAAAHATPSIPIPPPLKLNLTVGKILTISPINPKGPCIQCSPTLPLPPPKSQLFAR